MSQEQRLRKRIADAEASYERLRVRHDKLRFARELETRAEEQLRMDAVLERASSDMDAAERELSALEDKLAALLGPASAPVRARPFDIAFSHVPDDDGLLGELLVHIDPLVRSGVTVWPERESLSAPDAGSAPREVIESARILVLMASPAYLAAREIREVHLPIAMRRAGAESALVIPLILRACDWRSAAFHALSPLPQTGVPVVAAADRDPVWVEIAQALRVVTRSQ